MPGRQEPRDNGGRKAERPAVGTLVLSIIQKSLLSPQHLLPLEHPVGEGGGREKSVSGEAGGFPGQARGLYLSSVEGWLSEAQAGKDWASWNAALRQPRGSGVWK